MKRTTASRNDGTNTKKTRARAKDKIQDDSGKIWLNGKFVDRPNYVTSYGILFYRKATVGSEAQENQVGRTSSTVQKDERQNMPGNNTKGTQCSRGEFEYLLGLIPQGHSWTVFKGLSESNERPEDTAIREFEEESSLEFPYPRDALVSGSLVESELYGVTSTKKLLQIFLIAAPPTMDVSKFNVDKVVKIDTGRFSGVPEIVEIRFLTKNQATERGIHGKGKTNIAKIYKSQIPILERAETILNQRE